MLGACAFACRPRPRTRKPPVTALFEVQRYKIEVALAASFDRIKVSAGLVLRRTPRRSAGGTLSLTLCKGFKGVRFENVRITDERRNPVRHTVEGHRIAVPDPPEVVVVHYNLVQIKASEPLPYASFAFLASKTMFHINASITRADNWYPRVKGSIYKPLPPFELLVDSPRNFEVMASGRLHGVVRKKQRKVFHWINYRGMTDRSLYVFGSSELIKKQKTYGDGFKVWMYVPRGAVEASVERIADIVHKSYRLFERRFGATGLDEYKVMAFKYGYAGLFNSMGAPMRLFTKPIKDNDIGFPSRSLVHEVSHTWWGNLLKFIAKKHYWLFEGFAKLSEIVGTREVLGLSVQKKSFGRLKLVSQALLEFAPAVLKTDTVKLRRLHVVAAYYMGALFLNLLRHVMGEKRFWAGMKDYVRTFRGRYVVTDDFRRAMQKHTRADLKSLFADYLTKPGFARYRIVMNKVVATGGIYHHTYSIENVSDKDIYAPVLVKSSLQTRTTFLKLAKGQSALIAVRTRTIDEKGLISVDPENILPVWRHGIRGGGGFLYLDPKGNPRFIWIMKDSPFARVGIKNKMTLLEVNGKKVATTSVEELNRIFFRPRETVVKVKVKELPAPVLVRY